MDIKGYLKITSLDKDNNIIDINEGNNAIMNTGRLNVVSAIQGLNNSSSEISRFVLGTGGYNGGTTPAAFLPSRINTFSEANGDDYFYLDFSTDENTGVVTITDEEGSPSNFSTVTVTRDDSTASITYRFQIPNSNANGTGVREYNEAALYCNNAPDGVDRLFSFRTYNIRTKDSTVSFDIEWTITFG